LTKVEPARSPRRRPGRCLPVARSGRGGWSRRWWAPG